MSDNCRGLHLKKLQLASNSQPSNTYDLLGWQKKFHFYQFYPGLVFTIIFNWIIESIQASRCMQLFCLGTRPGCILSWNWKNWKLIGRQRKFYYLILLRKPLKFFKVFFHHYFKCCWVSVKGKNSYYMVFGYPFTKGMVGYWQVTVHV